MNHPTTAVLFEFIDNRLGKGPAADVASHLAECARCRRSVELENSTRRLIKSEPLIKAPDRLAARVMVNVVSPGRDPLFLRLLGKLGSIVAMIVVLAVIGLAISRVSAASGQTDDGSTSITNVVTPLSEVYEKGIQSYANGTSTIVQSLEKDGSAQLWKTVFIIALSVGVLVAADRVFGRRFLKLKS